MKKDLKSLSDLSAKEIESLFRKATLLKKERKRGKVRSTLRGKTLAMLFEKTSTRTRVSFEIAMRELGGDAVYLESGTTQVGRGETYADTAKVLSRYAHGILIRTYGQGIVEELAKASDVPVINGLSDLYHPCQILADLFTVGENKRERRKVAYIGDGNNIANSWIQAALLLRFPLVVATPHGFEPDRQILEVARNQKDVSVIITDDPVEAVRGAAVVNTDTWFSMGQKEEEEKRRRFQPYQLNQKLLKEAAPDAIVLHCLPAHRGEEITDEVMDGSQSRIWQQAENRLHVQKALLEMLLK
ncbi:MAG: ornithine carbamoyltransferase [Deltaproteobacteria bacterium]|nr:ornithine carbamoyltransferase [Deltaproteobacteria bacterium]MBI2501208.1 ornithine carbamoyltransferase [Deltaproteobacteria bacterium]